MTVSKRVAPQSVAWLLSADNRGQHKTDAPRPQPWRPTLSANDNEPPKKCLGDLVREQAERESRIGSPTIGTAGDGDHRLVESWYERHPELLPTDTTEMTPQAKRLEGQRRTVERIAAEAAGTRIKRQRRKKDEPKPPKRNRAAYMRTYHRRTKAAKAQRIPLSGTVGWNLHPLQQRPGLRLQRRRQRAAHSSSSAQDVTNNN